MASGTIWAQGIKLGTGAGATTAYNLVSTNSYVIEKVASTYYARPGIGTGYTAYSGASFKTTIESAMGQLTTGGTIFIKAGLYDNLDPIVIPDDYITIQGAGKYLTKLKLKANADAAGGFAWTGLIDCVGHNYFTIKDIELDGNGANQTLIDAGASQTARLFGIRVGYTGYVSAFALIENCYVHNFTVNGIQLHTATDCIVRNCISNNNNWNNISSFGSRIIIENCQTTGCADVSISIEGSDHIVRNCTVGNTSGVNGSVNSHWGISSEVQIAAGYRNNIINNNVTGANTVNGIRFSAQHTQYDSFVTGNYIYDLSAANSSGIYIQAGINITVSNNRILRVNGQGFIAVGATTYSEISNNTIDNSADGTDAGSSYGINIDGNSTYNKIINNVVINHYGINIGSGSNNNYILGNYSQSTSGWTYDFKNAGTGNICANNVLFGRYAITNSFAPETVNKNFAVTATTDGLTTGILVSGSQNLTVTSANAAYIICLPAAGATTIGTKITGIVTANGCDLRVQAAQATTVYLNGLTTNVEADIPANSSFEVTCIDATHWILKAWTNLGAPITAIVPHAN